MDAMVAYGTLRKYLIEKYPQSQQDAKKVVKLWMKNQMNPTKSISIKPEMIQRQTVLAISA